MVGAARTQGARQDLITLFSMVTEALVVHVAAQLKNTFSASAAARRGRATRLWPVGGE